MVPVAVPIMVAAAPIPVAGRAGTFFTVSLASPRLATFLNVPVHVVPTVFALVPPVPHVCALRLSNPACWLPQYPNWI